MKVTYLDHMGSDLTVVNAARGSFGKRKAAFDEKDERLIRYLATHKHMLPFRHPQVSMHWKAPIFVARQLVKHQVGMSWSEISRRYVTTEPELYWPEGWRQAAADKKQGSAEEFVDFSNMYQGMTEDHTNKQILLYKSLVSSGVAPEQARMVLPQNAYTEWVWTGSLLSWAHLWALRVEHTAQKETQDIVKQIDPLMRELFPISWSVLTEG